MIFLFEFLQLDNRIFFREINFTKKFRENDLTENCVLQFFCIGLWWSTIQPFGCSSIIITITKGFAAEGEKMVFTTIFFMFQRTFWPSFWCNKRIAITWSQGRRQIRFKSEFLKSKIFCLLQINLSNVYRWIAKKSRQKYRFGIQSELFF